MGEEISLSVDDTNALMENLGLKPLQISRDIEAIPEDTVVDRKTENEAKLDVEVNDGKRLVEELSSGGGILDLLDESGSILDSIQTSAKRSKCSDAEIIQRGSGSNSSRNSSVSDSSDSESNSD
jgi:hypothetical protein